MDLKLCRICLNKGAKISLFASEGEIQYSAQVMRCVNVVVVEGDGLPDSICEPCVADLLACYHFVNKCEASDKVLRSANVLDTHIKTEVSDRVLRGADEPFSSFKIEMLEVKNEKEIETEFNDYELDKMLPDHFSDSFQEFPVKYKRKYTKRSGVIDRRKLRPKMGPSKCDICGQIATCKSALRDHMRIHTGEKPFACDVCGACFNLKGTLKRHIMKHNTQRERKFVCETCGNGFFTKYGIITHMRVHTDEKPYSCPFCRRGFKQISSLIRHKRSHTGEKPFKCNICNKRFAELGAMKVHQKYVHSDEKTFFCQLCNKSVKTKNALRVHLKTHSDEKQNVCSYCGMMFNFKGNLTKHIKTVHSEKSGHCNICLKTFSDLEAHMCKHTGQKPFVCKLCDQAFATKRSMSHHMSFRHNNSAKYKCSIGECSKTFPIASMLEFHLMKQHTNHTPFMCQHCSRGFYRMCDLTKHLRMGHMDMSLTVDCATSDTAQ